MNKKYTAGIVPIYKANDKYLYLIVQGKENGFWSFPKGQVNQGETIQECAQRELFEETGMKEIEVDFTQPYEMIFPFTKDGVEHTKILTFFYGYVANTEIHIQESEILNHKRATLDECLELLSFGNLKEMILYINNRLG